MCGNQKGQDTVVFLSLCSCVQANNSLTSSLTSGTSPLYNIGVGAYSTLLDLGVPDR